MKKQPLKKILSDLEARIRTMEAEFQMYQTEILQIKGQFQRIIDQTTELQNKIKEKTDTLELIQNPEENEKKLRDITEKRKNDLKTLSMKWEEKRKPLVTEYRTLKDTYARREEIVQQKLGEVKLLRKQIETMENDIAKKENQYHQLTEIFKQLPKEKKIYIYY